MNSMFLPFRSLSTCRNFGPALLAGMLCGLGLSLYAQTPNQVPPPVTITTEVVPKLGPAELQDLLAPIALYPDALIAIILPASTVPADVVIGSRFLESNTDISLVDAQPWDDSVKSLTRYPDVLFWMNENLEWTASVGEAFVVQPAEVMDAIQKLRVQAQILGNLVDTPQQNVVVREEIILIVPADPEVIYVPQYDPEVVYVETYQPNYTPFITFGVGFAVGTWLSYDFDWNRQCVYRGDWRGWNDNNWNDGDWNNNRNNNWGRGNENAINNTAVNNNVNVVNISNESATQWQPSAESRRQVNQRQRNNTGNARFTTTEARADRAATLTAKPVSGNEVAVNQAAPATTATATRRNELPRPSRLEITADGSNRHNNRTGTADGRKRDNRPRNPSGSVAADPSAPVAAVTPQDPRATAEGQPPSGSVTPVLSAPVAGSTPPNPRRNRGEQSATGDVAIDPSAPLSTPVAGATPQDTRRTRAAQAAGAVNPTGNGNRPTRSPNVAGSIPSSRDRDRSNTPNTSGTPAMSPRPNRETRVTENPPPAPALTPAASTSTVPPAPVGEGRSATRPRNTPTAAPQIPRQVESAVPTPGKNTARPGRPDREPRTTLPPAQPEPNTPQPQLEQGLRAPAQQQHQKQAESKQQQKQQQDAEQQQRQQAQKQAESKQQQKRQQDAEQQQRQQAQKQAESKQQQKQQQDAEQQQRQQAQKQAESKQQQKQQQDAEQQQRQQAQKQAESKQQQKQQQDAEQQQRQQAQKQAESKQQQKQQEQRQVQEQRQPEQPKGQPDQKAKAEDEKSD